MIDAGRELVRMRAAAPLVHNITNFVAMGTMANVLLAAGASPAMIHAPEEAAEFAALADALTINIGTLSADWLASMTQAAATANAVGRPWVLDPVAVGATAFRRAAGRRLLALTPTLIRGNASEIIALAQGDHGKGAGRGVDAADEVASAESAALALARVPGTLVAVTGAVDFVTDGQRAARIRNGHPLMPCVTALGCALTGVTAAFLGAGCERFDGVVAALAYYGLAGEMAAAQADGPGSFAVQFLDALARMDADTLDKGAQIDDVSLDTEARQGASSK